MRKKCDFKLGFPAKENFSEKNAKFLFLLFSRNFRISYIAKNFAFCVSEQNAKKCKIFAMFFSRKIHNFLETFYSFRWKPYFKRKVFWKIRKFSINKRDSLRFVFSCICKIKTLRGTKTYYHTQKDKCFNLNIRYQVWTA